MKYRIVKYTLLGKFYTVALLSIATVSNGQTYSETELALDRNDRIEIEEWEGGKRGVCERTNHVYFYNEDVNTVADFRYENCLDLEYLLEDSIPELRNGREAIEGLIVPSAATDFSALSHYVNLKYLSIYTVPQTYLRPNYQTLNLAQLGGLNQLERLHINVREPLALGMLAPLNEVPSLTHLSIVGWNNADLSEIARLENLESLMLYDGNSPQEALVSINQLSSLIQLKRLDLARQGALSDIAAVAQMPLLEEVDFSSTKVADIDALSALHNLRFVNLEYTDVSSIEALRGKPDLIWLSLWGTKVTDLSPLAESSRLRRLDLTDVPFKSLEPLAGMTELEVLVISDYAYLDSKSLVDLGPLLSLPALRTIIIDPDRVSAEQTAAFEAKGIMPWLGDIAYEGSLWVPPQAPDAFSIEESE